MGRYSWSNRQMVEDCKTRSILDPEIKIEVRDFQPDSYLYLKLYRDNIQVNQQNIFVGKTAIFGKPWVRHWFNCPKCNRRVLKLYLPRKENYYACRKCHNLTYRSQKKRNGFQERFLMQFIGSRRLAWRLLDSLHGK